MVDHMMGQLLPLLGLAYALSVLWTGLRWGWHWVQQRRWRVAPPRLPAGLLERPPCPACAVAPAVVPHSEPPPPIAYPCGRPRSVDTSSHYCPRQGCRYYGWVGLGNIRANGHPNGGPWRQLECVVCGQTFMETTHTIFYRKRVPAETIWRTLTALAEGLDIRGAARVFDLDPNTVQTWLRQAAQHMDAVSHYLIHDLHLTQVQVDELWALLGRRAVDPQSQQKQRQCRWVWAGMDPASKLLLACVVGDRGQTCARLLIHAIAVLLAPGCVPLFVSDQWAAYGTALLTHFGHWVAVPRRYARGRRPKPRWRPVPGLHYAQVVKQRVRGRVVGVTHRVVYGSLARVQAVLQQSGVGRVINTAFSERLNQTIRQHVAALGRKVASLAKGEPGLRDQLALWRGYYNFCLPHTALRVLLPVPQPTKGMGSPKKWQPRTPAMAAGVTARVWRLEELLRWPVPPWRQTIAVTV